MEARANKYMSWLGTWKENTWKTRDEKAWERGYPWAQADSLWLFVLHNNAHQRASTTESTLNKADRMTYSVGSVSSSP